MLSQHRPSPHFLIACRTSRVASRGPSLSAPDSIFATRTTTKLLDALHDEGNEPVWMQFDARYRPVIAALARRLGLDPTDAEEVAQQTLSEFVKAYRDGRYDRNKGRLSSWILGIARNSSLQVMRGRRRAAGSADQPEFAEESALRPIWDQERDREILMRALAMLRDESTADPKTLEAFELTALRGVPAAETAAQCGMSVEQVYVAKSRLTKKLRGLVEAMTTAFENDV